MSSQTAKPRSNSPFRFKRPASVNGKLPVPSPTSSTSSPHAHGSLPRVSLSSRPSTPAGGSVNQNYRSISLQSVSSSSVSGGSMTSPPERMEFSSNKTKENVVVTVRFRPLSAREIQRGDEVAWYADGDTTVRSEYNPSTGYAFDRVFGPATTTRGVYDVAAQHVVSGAMEGMNGTVFAYGVTSSGKTHTMHGDQKSPGIIPLAVKDVFNIIQETPGKEYLLRVSYLEIYNEVINDLLDPAGQNLRIREDAQGTYVEGIKEEVVLSPAHALSLIATGEEHRHVGSNNFNLMSSRSHTIFTLTIESSVCGEGHEGTLSQLNLIDLAGSESSKTETTGLRRKEGSYINKSLLTLGTVISKLTDGKASHIPYRDSKLTRLLQSSLSGRGRVSLICTVTPASSSNEETHNTLKFAHRTKCVEVHASPNKILDEKSLIKKYQKEIMSLKQELEQLKRGIFEKPFIVNNQQDLATLRQQLEAGQVQLQSRLEEEEQAKAALMGRIQRLTKLILVSTKTSVPTIPERTTHRRRYSFGEEELAYLPDRRRTLALEDEDDLNLSGLDLETSGDGKCDSNSGEDISREEKKSKRRGMLAWFKLKKHESLAISPVGSLDAEHFMNGSPMSNIPSTAHIDSPVEGKGSRGKPPRKKSDGPVVDSFPEYTQAGELFSATIHGRRPPPTGTTMADQMDLLREQVKMLAGEVAFCTSALKRLSEQAASNPDDTEVQMQMQKLKDEVQEKRQQMKLLEKRIVGTTENSPPSTSPYELSQTITKLTTQLNEKAFELEIKTADNRILQEQFQAKTVENKTLQETIDTLKGQLQSFMEGKGSLHKKGNFHNEFTRKMGNITESEETNDWLSTHDASRELRGGEAGNNGGLLGRSFPRDASVDSALQSQVLSQAAEIEKLKQEKVRLVEEKEGLQVHSQKLSEEASYAKELATAAAVELKNLAEEVTKLSGQNSKLSHELANTKELALSRITSNGPSKHMPNKAHKDVQPHEEMNGWKVDFPAVIEELKKDLQVRIEKEIALEALLAEKDKKEAEFQKRMEEAKHREADLENDLASMWVLVAKLRRERTELNDMPTEDIGSNLRDNYVKKLNNLKRLNDGVEGKVGKENMTKEALKSQSVKDQQKIMELELLISQLKSEHLDGLDIPALDDLQNLHVEALTKLCQAKIRAQQRLEAEREGYLQEELVSRLQTETISGSQFLEDNRNGHVCKVCFEEPSAAVLLPCRHFCLCKSCAVACAECPLCRTGITDRIITFTS